MSHIRNPLEIVDSLDFVNTAFNKVICEKECTADKEQLKSVLQFVDGVLYAWCEAERCIATILTKNVLLGTNKDKCQLLRPTKPIADEVITIQINESATRMAIVSKSTLSIMLLPRRWGVSGGFEGDVPEISCSTYILEALCTPSEVERVRWHPGSAHDDLLAVLFNNNVVKMFDTSVGDLIERWAFGKEFGVKKPSFLSMVEYAVDFAFVPQIKVKGDLHDGNVSVPTFKSPDAERWTILILMSNGDVYTMYSYLTHDGLSLFNFMVNNVANTLRGPLLMFPAAEDNYGVDVSSILVLEGPPPIIIIASCTGTLYNCMLLPHSTYENYEVKQNRSLEDSKLGVVRKPPEYALHGLQSIDFDMDGIRFHSPKNIAYSEYSSFPVNLIEDTTNKTRFFVVHMGGVHCISMPVIHELTMYFNQDNSVEKEQFMPNLARSKVIADYIFCTRSNLCNNIEAPIGMTSADLPMPVALVLTSNGINTIHLRAWNMHSNFEPKPASETHKIEEVNLVEQIKTILCRKDDNPFLKISAHKRASPEAILEFLCKATGYFREEVVPRHYQAAQLLNSRKVMLAKMSIHKAEELKNLSEQKKMLQAQAEILSEKYEERNEALTQLSRRAHKCIARVKTLQTAITDPEKLMRMKLDQINSDVFILYDLSTALRKKVDIVYTNKLKECYQNLNPKHKKTSSPLFMDGVQKTTIKENLTKMTADLNDLVGDVKKMFNGLNCDPDLNLEGV